MVSNLHADGDQIQAFIGALFRYAEVDTFVSLRAFHQLKLDVPPVFIRPLKLGDNFVPLTEAATLAAEECAQRSDSTVFAAPICTFTNPEHARGVDLANGLVLSVEVDLVDPEQALQRLEGLLGPATIVMRSGSDWTDQTTGELKPNVHMHWRLSEPTVSQADHDLLRLARTLAAQLVGADPTAKSIVHPLRWPGSWNLKAAPRMAVIAARNDAAEINLTDAVDVLEGAIEAEGWARAEMPEPSGSPEAPLADVRSAMAAIPNLGGDVHYSFWIRLGYAVYRATGGSPDGFAVWDSWSRLSDKYDADETQRSWRRIANAITGAPPTRIIGAGTIFYLARQAGWARVRPFASSASGDGHWSEPDDPGARQSRSERRPILSLQELDALPPPEWLIANLVPEAGLVVPYGPPKSGKTFLILSAGLHIAAGDPWFGNAVKQGAVVYIAGEGVGGLSLRLRAMRMFHGIGVEVPFWVIPRAVNFRIDAEVRALADLVRQTIGVTPLRLLVIDTLARAMPGADENSAQEVGVVIAGCDWLREELGATIMPVHHSGKDEGRGARGTSALRGAWDAAFKISGGKKSVTLTVVDQKDSEAGQRLLFELRHVVVGLDRSSLVPVLVGPPEESESCPSEHPNISEHVRVVRRLSSMAILGLRTLTGLLESVHSKIVPLAGQRSSVRVVEVDAFRREFYSQLPTHRPDAKRMAFTRTFLTLQEHRLIATSEPWVWLTNGGTL